MTTADRTLFGPRSYAVRDAIARRLVERHGLSHLAAQTAVARAAVGTPGRHHHLVLAEQDALIREALQGAATVFAELLPHVRQMADTVTRLTDAVASLVPRRARPAWQSSYGPAQKGRRR